MIQDILESKIVAAGRGVPGATLFRTYMPAAVSIGIMTRVPLDGLKSEKTLPGYYRGQIQIITRHTDPVEGRLLALAAGELLSAAGEETYDATTERGGVKINFFLPETLPVEFPRLEGDGLEWSQHFTTTFSVFGKPLT